MTGTSSASRTVVVTGASTGIGRASALRMAARGYAVFAGVRREEDGEALRRESPDKITPLILDVTRSEQIADAAARVTEAVGGRGLGALVNNAGICIGGPLEFVSLDDLRRQFEVNVFGVVALTQSFTEILRLGRGRIVNVSSLAGRVSQPFLGPYCASKHALEGLTDATRMELAPWGIEVCLIEPGSIDTPIWSKVEAAVAGEETRLSPRARSLYGDALKKIEAAVKRAMSTGTSPELVANAVEHAICASKPKVRYRIGRGARGAMLLHSFLPNRMFDSLLRGQMGL